MDLYIENIIKLRNFMNFRFIITVSNKRIIKMKRFLILSVAFMLFVSPVFADTVVYNTKTGKFHTPGCQWAKKCTVNCMSIDRKEVIKRGGVLCKVCGGREFNNLYF